MAKTAAAQPSETAAAPGLAPSLNAGRQRHATATMRQASTTAMASRPANPSARYHAQAHRSWSHCCTTTPSPETSAQGFSRGIPPSTTSRPLARMNHPSVS